SANGVLLAPTGVGSLTKAVLDHVGLYNNGFAGLNVISSVSNQQGGGVSATVTDSVASNSPSTPGGGGYGFLGQSPNNSMARIMLQRCTAANNVSTGILALGLGAQIFVNQSLVFDNGGGWDAPSGGTILSSGTNFVFNNHNNDASQGSYPLE